MGRAQPINYRLSKKEFFDFHASFEGRSTPSKSERKLAIDKFTKKYLRDKGIIGTISQRYKWNATLPDLNFITVVAYNRSEARARIKQELGVNKLPKDIVITRGDYETIVS